MRIGCLLESDSKPVGECVVSKSNGGKKLLGPGLGLVDADETLEESSGRPRCSLRRLFKAFTLGLRRKEYPQFLGSGLRRKKYPRSMGSFRGLSGVSV